MLIESERIVRRPFKLTVEIRRGAGGKYTVSVVTSWSRVANLVVRALCEAGYEEAAPVVDRYGHLRIVYRGLEEGDVVAIRNIVRDALLGAGREGRGAPRPQRQAVSN